MAWWGAMVGATVASDCMSGGSCGQGLQVTLELQTGSCRIAAFLLTIICAVLILSCIPEVT
jgi:hypothetical protein